MSSGTSQITLSTPRPTKNSVTVLATTQTVYETGQIVIYDSSSIEVARSTTRTVASQSSLDIDVYGLLPGNEYTAKFYNEDNMDFSSSTVGFTTLEDNKLYGGVSGAVARQITALYGGSNSGAQRITKLYSGIEDVDQWVITSIENNPGIDLAKFMSMLRSIHGPIANYADKPGTLSAVPDPVSQSRVDMYLAGRGDSAYLFSYTFGSYAGEGASWGFPSEPQLGRVTSSYERPIISKLIHQGFGHLSYN